MATNQWNRSDLGFTRDLFIMPFDHRGSFQEKLFGIKGRAPTETETAEIAKYKKTIFEGFKQAVAAGVPNEKAGILVDEQFGSDILKEAHTSGFMTACPVEKSGQDEFDFEYGAEFGAHISKFNPTFVKALVRYNPQADAALNQKQSERLKQLSDYCHAHSHKFMFELLVPAVPSQLALVKGDVALYDRTLRPTLMIESIRELQEYGIEPDVWKVEGLETAEDSHKVASQARSGEREQVGVIMLGRGENAAKVRQWLSVAARIPGIIGFAVGRTIFWEPLKKVKEGQQSHAEAADQIAQNYKGFCDLWKESKSQ